MNNKTKQHKAQITIRTMSYLYINGILTKQLNEPVKQNYAIKENYNE